MNDEKVLKQLKIVFGKTAKLIKVDGNRVLFSRYTFLGNTFGETTIKELFDHKKQANEIEHIFGI